MKKCPACNEEYGDGATYCEKCGTKLVKYCTCPHCGEPVQDDAVFCSKCGKAIDSVEPVSSYIEPSAPSSKVVDDATIQQYKREIESYKSKRLTFLILGAIFLTVGLVLTIVFMSLYIKAIDKGVDSGNLSTAYLYLFLAVVFELMTDAGIAFLIIQGAVFGRKISNRIRAIEEYESRH